jgi:nitrilase
VPAPTQSFKIAAVQTAPVYLDRDATVEKACGLIAEAAGNGACLVVFPESFIPAYPDWVWSVPPGQGDVQNEMYGRLVENAVEIPGAATQRLCREAKRARVHVAVGMTERNVEASGGSLYNTLLYIDSNGAILGKHRKLVPTGGERLVWAQGDGSTLEVYDTPFGKLGGLICWENYMPPARYAMYAWGTQVYVAATWDRGEPWLSTLRHIGKEGRVYVVGCCMAIRKSDILDRAESLRPFYERGGEWINSGDSAIVDPNGEFLAGPLHNEEGILYADIDPARQSGAKWILDVAGHYSRPDVFEFIVHTEPRPVITSRDIASASGQGTPRKKPRRKKAQA